MVTDGLAHAKSVNYGVDAVGLLATALALQLASRPVLRRRVPLRCPCIERGLNVGIQLSIHTVRHRLGAAGRREYGAPDVPGRPQGRYRWVGTPRLVLSSWIVTSDVISHESQRYGRRIGFLA